MKNIPLWFYIVMAIATAIGVIVSIWFPTSKRLRENAEWKGEVNAHKSNVTKILDEIKNDVKEIRDFLFGNRKVLSSESPLALTDLGKTISNEISAKDWAKKISPTLLEKVKQYSREFEIYEFCKNYMKHDFSPSEQELNQMREIAYNHGIDVSGVYSVLSIELRDELLKLIKLEDSDDHTEAQ